MTSPREVEAPGSRSVRSEAQSIYVPTEIPAHYNPELRKATIATALGLPHPT